MNINRHKQRGWTLLVTGGLISIGNLLADSSTHPAAIELPQGAEAVHWEGGQAAYVDHWSQLFILDVEMKGAFEISVKEKSEGISFEVAYQAPENPSNTLGQPAFFMGTLQKIEPAGNRIPVFTEMEAHVGGLPEDQPELDGRKEGLFYILMTPEEWEKLKAYQLPVSQSTAELNMLFVTRALPENLVYLAHAMRNLEGREVMTALMWSPGRFMTTPSQLEVKDLTLTLLDPPVSEARRLIDRIQPGAIGGLLEAESKAEKLEVILAHFADRFVEPRETTDVRPDSERLESANLMLEDMWRIVWAGGRDDHHRPLPVDWTLNPIDDPEWIWHLHWYRNFDRLVQAFHETGYVGYAQKWRDITRDWIEQNPPGTPHAWRSLDTAIRRGPLTGQIERMYNQSGVTDEDRVQFLNAIADAAEYLSDPIKYHAGGNWGTTETNSLATLGETYPEFSRSVIWRELSTNRAKGFQGQSVYADGSTDEMTVGYHMHTIHGLRGAYARISDKESEEAEKLHNTIENMYNYVLVLTKPDGELPQLGHSGQTSALSHLRTGAGFTGREDFRFVGTRGQQGEPPAFLDSFLGDSPHYVMRTSWTDDPMGHYLLVKATTRGRTGRDGFNLDFYAYGKTLVLNGGAYAYHDEWAEYFQASRNQSTVTVGGHNQSRQPDAVVKAFIQREAYSYFDAVMETYPGVQHRRRVVFVRSEPAYVIVLDDLEGEMEGEVTSTFLLSPTVEELHLDPDAQSVYSVTPGEADLLIREFRNPDAVMALRDGWQSYGYGRKNPRQGITLEVPSLPASFGTLLFPVRAEDEAAPRVEMAWDEATGVLMVKHAQGEDRMVLTDDGVSEFRRRRHALNINEGEG